MPGSGGWRRLQAAGAQRAPHAVPKWKPDQRCASPRRRLALARSLLAARRGRGRRQGVCSTAPLCKPVKTFVHHQGSFPGGGNARRRGARAECMLQAGKAAPTEASSPEETVSAFGTPLTCFQGTSSVLLSLPCLQAWLAVPLQGSDIPNAILLHQIVQSGAGSFSQGRPSRKQQQPNHVPPRAAPSCGQQRCECSRNSIGHFVSCSLVAYPSSDSRSSLRHR